LRYDSRTPETIVKDECSEWLTLNRWFHFNIKQAKYCYKGISDRIAMKGGIVLFIEFKTKKCKQSPEQLQFERDTVSKGCHYIIATKVEDILLYLELNT
jgi:hypothetical protein